MTTLTARVAAAASIAVASAAGSLLAAGPAQAAIPDTIVTIQQVSSGRFLDAHEISSYDYRMVTRPAQTDNTQKWRLTVVG